MAFLFRIILLLSTIGLTFPARINIDDMDYNSLMDLLSEYENERGGTQQIDQHIYDVNPAPGKAIIVQKPFLSSILAPNVEVLRLVEAFIKLKGEMATRVHILINDNWDLFRSVYQLILSKIEKVHGFTLMGISVLRKILEFAVSMINSWEVTKNVMFQ